MIILGFCFAFFVGFIMGLIGAGGSIVSSAILIYIFHFTPGQSTSYSLLTVAAISLVGSIRYYKLHLINLKLGLLFSIPAVILIYLMRKILMPHVPIVLFFIGKFEVSKNILIILVLALIMIVVATTMLKKRKSLIHADSKSNHYRILCTGSMVGLLTGFIGVGGGFMIVPALIYLLGVDVKKAIGTSLLVITINTAVGFISDLISGVYFNWSFLTIYITITISGMLLGTLLFGHLENKWIKKAFAYIVLLMGTWIIIKELVLFHV